MTTRFSSWRWLLVGVAVSMASCLSSGAPREQPTVTFTSLKTSSCKKPLPSIEAHFQQRGLSAQQCPGPKALKVYAVSSDERSWLEIEIERTLWSTEEQVVHRHAFGHFPNLGADTIEWQISDGRVTTVTFRIAAQDPQDSSKNPSRLFVVRVTDHAAYFCGVAKTNVDARSLAAPGSACSEKLKAHLL